MEPIDILYEAIGKEFGVVVETSDPKALRQKLYSVKANNSAFAELSILTSRTNPNGELWIVRKNGNPETHLEPEKG